MLAVTQASTTARYANEPPEFAGQCAGAVSDGSGRRCRLRAKQGYVVCHKHGGSTPRGAASPKWKHGRRSRYQTTGFVGQVYRHARSDPELTSCAEEAALLVAFIQERLSRIQESCSNKWWAVLAKARQKALAAKLSGNTLEMAAAFNELLEAVESGERFARLAEEIADLAEKKSRVAEREWKRLVVLRQMMSAEQVLQLMQGLMLAVEDAVERFAVDRKFLTVVSQKFIAVSGVAAAIQQPVPVASEGNGAAKGESLRQLGGEL